MTDLTTALLVRARGYLERGWCRNALARNILGLRVEPESKWAVAWCMYGGLAAAGLPLFGYSHAAFRRLEAALNGEWPCDFNNRQETVEPVLAAFDRAIAAGNGGR